MRALRALLGCVAVLWASTATAELKIEPGKVKFCSSLSFEDCMRTEFRVVSRVARGHDFYEGVRAAVIDKDNAPRWQPPDLAGVSEADVARYFADLGADELTLP